MFRRKEDGTEELIPENEQTTTPTSSSTSSNAPAFAAATPVAPAAQPAPNFRPTPPQAAMVAANRTPATPIVPTTPVTETRTAATPVTRPNAKRVLTVGPDIQMKGEISSCDRVVIEGMVDATMRDVHTVELAETGSLKGTAEVEDAEISGAFEGDLVVRGKLTVYSAGRVRGNITYGEIEIQRGGQISGNVRNVAEAKGGQTFPVNKAKVA
jgi:cytoskeletal protein CcmA (bactofilin family)